MKDKELFRLMQFIPDEFPEETAEFLAAHQKTKNAEPVIRKTQTEPRGILWRIMMPVCTAACIALIIGAGVRATFRENPLTETSSQPEITLIAEQTSTASPVTATTQSVQKQTVTRTVTETLPVQQTASTAQNGTSAGTEASAAPVIPQTTAKPAAQSTQETTAASVPPSAPYYPPGDVNMNGKVDVNDAQILLDEYKAVVENGGESTLTPEQIALGDVYPNTAKDDQNAFIDRIPGFNLDVIMIPTDYPISYEDGYLVLVYASETDIAHNYKDLDIYAFAKMYGLPPEDPGIRFLSDPVIMQGDTLPADSVMIQNCGSYPGHTEEWELQYARLHPDRDFALWYDGKGSCEGYQIMISGLNSHKTSRQKSIAYKWEREYGLSGAFTVGDTEVYHPLNLVPVGSGENWREENRTQGRDALYWMCGEYIIRVYTQEPYPDDVLQKIAECFAAVPVN